MNIPIDQKRNGQTLVQVAILMVVVIACLVIAIDVGHLLTERRRMQNAADAGALAGAWEICFGDPSMAVATAEETAAEKNGAQVADVSIDEWRVTVHASEEADMYLAGIFGIVKSHVGAVAVAACGDAFGASAFGCGLWPISFHEERWNRLDDGWDDDESDVGVFYVFTDGKFEEDDPCYGEDEYGDCVPMCDQYVIDPITGEYVIDPETGERVLDKAGYCDCDLMPPDNEMYRVGPGDRGWLLFPRPERPFDDDEGCTDNCGDQVRCWIARGSLDGVPLPASEGFCLPGHPGVDESVRIEIERNWELSYPNVLLWDRACDPNNPDDVVHGTCPGNLYHIAGMGCIKVLEVMEVDLQEKPEYWNPLQPDTPQFCMKNVKVIKAKKLNPCTDPCGGTHGDPPVPGRVRSVSLLK
jgi:hypothetical protein